MNDQAQVPPDDAACGQAPAPVDDRVRRVELLISSLLRIGVVSSLAVIVAGLVLSFVHHADYAHSRDELQQILSPNRPAGFHSLRELRIGLAEGRGQALIMVGLLLLIATPVMRVGVSILTFLYQRDWPFVLITTFVLAMLILSFFLGKVE